MDKLFQQGHVLFLQKIEYGHALVAVKVRSTNKAREKQMVIVGEKLQRWRFFEQPSLIRKNVG